MRRIAARFAVATFAVAALAAGIAALSATDAYASRKPPKPCPNCAPTITLPDGRVCTLDACGFDCVYTCPF